MTRRLILATLLALSVSSTTVAKVYVGAAAGQTTLKRTEFATDFDAKDTSWKVYAGFRIFKLLGVEASYNDMGSPDDAAGGYQFKADTKSWDAFAVGVLPLGRFEVFAKAGVVYWKTDTIITGGSIPTFRNKDSGVDAAYGAGAAFKFAKLLAIRAEYEKFEVGGGANLHMTSLGLDIRF